MNVMSAMNSKFFKMSIVKSIYIMSKQAQAHVVNAVMHYKN